MRQSLAPHVRVATHPFVWACDDQGIGFMVALDVWRHGDAVSVFVCPHLDVEARESAAPLLAALATSALQAIHKEIGAGVDFAMIEWFFILTWSNGTRATKHVVFGDFYADRIKALKPFPESNDVTLYGTASFPREYAYRDGLTDVRGTTRDYRRSYLSALYALARSCDEAYGPLCVKETWFSKNPDQGSMSMVRSERLVRTLIARRSKRRLDMEIAAFVAAQSDTMHVRMLERKHGFHGAAVEYIEVDGGHKASSCRGKRYRVQERHRPTWRCPWTTRTPVTGYVPEW